MSSFLFLHLAVLGGTSDLPSLSADETTQLLLAQFSEAFFPPESTLTARNAEDDKRAAREALARLEPLIAKDRVAGLKQLFLFRLTNPRKVAKPKSTSGVLLAYFAFTFSEIDKAKTAFASMKDPKTQHYLASFDSLPPEDDYLAMCKEWREKIKRGLGVNNKEKAEPAH